MMDGSCRHFCCHPRKPVFHRDPGNAVEKRPRIENDRNLGVWIHESGLVIRREVFYKLADLARGGLIGMTRVVQAA